MGAGLAWQVITMGANHVPIYQSPRTKKLIKYVKSPWSYTESTILLILKCQSHPHTTCCQQITQSCKWPKTCSRWHGKWNIVHQLQTTEEPLNTIHTTYFVLWPSSSSKDFIYPGCHNFSCSISLYIKSLKSFLLFFFVLFLMHNTFLFLFSKCEKIQHQVVNCIFHKFPLL